MSCRCQTCSEGEDREPNIPMLRKYVEWVEEQEALPRDQRNWDQNTWYRKVTRFFHPRDEEGRFIAGQQKYEICGTAYCVAGKVAVDAGFAVIDGGQIASAPQGLEAWNGKAVSAYAAEVLGLSGRQAADLFKGKNKARDIRSLAESFAGENL